MTEPQEPAAEAAEGEDDVRRRFREALERKQGKGAPQRTQHGEGRTAGPASNEKRQRQFRRKSG